ncbi:hypothetical protein DH2020_006357 [Rehmannia glutinosa]|uniref:Uncharacterized protein n=1 Tax=Rehmannia glutinosa TaxID=99300 RepID=A0ABR0XJ71_REHGL
MARLIRTALRGPGAEPPGSSPTRLMLPHRRAMWRMQILRRKYIVGAYLLLISGQIKALASSRAVHKVSGQATGLLLLHIPANRRHDAVVTISYEAQARALRSGLRLHIYYYCFAAAGGITSSRAASGANSAAKQQICYGKCT